jgi:hypothetical protein
MNCFYHPDTPAVALCKYCQKGLCTECAIDLGSGMSCRNHKKEVQELNEVFAANQRTSQGSGLLFKRFAWVFVFLGLAMIGGGFFLGPFGYIIGFTGLASLLFGGVYYFWGRRYEKPKSKKAKGSTHEA